MIQTMAWKDTLKKLRDPNNHEVLIASHRGRFGSSVMENSRMAFLLAVAEGADMVEMDLDRTKDGKIVAHHDRSMMRLFHKDSKICEWTLAELKEMPLYNCYGGQNASQIDSFQEILDALKDKTILILDRCWHCWDDVYDLLMQNKMLEQAIFKFNLDDNNAFQWAYAHPDCMFIPITGDIDLYPLAFQLQHIAKVPALEILPVSPESPCFQDHSFAQLKDHGLKVWCNALDLSRELVYGAGFDDLTSLRDGGNAGWGVLISHGVTIIQTDFPIHLKRYLVNRGIRPHDMLQVSKFYHR